MSYYFTLVERKHYPLVFDYREELLNYKSAFDGCFELNKFESIESWDFNNKLFEDERTLPPGYSIGFQYLYMNDDELIGMVNFRPKAESHPYLSQYGGHIGYNIRPTKRGQGLGTKMLRDFLPIAKKFGLEKVMISCMEDNVSSRKIIINNVGEFESKAFYSPECKMIERYWIKL